MNFLATQIFCPQPAGVPLNSMPSWTLVFPGSAHAEHIGQRRQLQQFLQPCLNNTVFACESCCSAEEREKKKQTNKKHPVARKHGKYERTRLSASARGQKSYLTHSAVAHLRRYRSSAAPAHQCTLYDTPEQFISCRNCAARGSFTCIYSSANNNSERAGTHGRMTDGRAAAAAGRWRAGMSRS